MEIEITMQEPVFENTISNKPNNSDITTTEIIDEPRDAVGTTKTLEKPKKVLSNEDINTIIDNIINDIGDYLTENTEFYHMKDEIINKRMRVIMKEKFYVKIGENILEFIEFLGENENIQEYIEINNKVIYDVRCLDNIHLSIYDYLYNYVTDYDIDITEGWLNWNERKGRFCNHDNFDINFKDFLIEKIVKYVFQLSDCYEFIDNPTKSLDENKNEEEQYNNSDENNSNDENDSNDENNSNDDNNSNDENEFNKNKQNNECVIT